MPPFFKALSLKRQVQQTIKQLALQFFYVSLLLMLYTIIA